MVVGSTAVLTIGSVGKPLFSATSGRLQRSNPLLPRVVRLPSVTPSGRCPILAPVRNSRARSPYPTLRPLALGGSWVSLAVSVG